MKILLLSIGEYPPDPNTGGIGTYNRYLAHGLRELGHEVHVMVGDLATEFTRDKEMGIHIHTCKGPVPNLRLKIREKEYGLYGLEEIFKVHGYPAIRTAYNVKKKVKKLMRAGLKFDILETPEIGAPGFFLRKEIPCAVKFHTPSYLINKHNEGKKELSRLTVNFEKAGIEAAAVCTSPSRFMAGEVSSLYGLKRKVQVIPNGINIKEIDDIQAVDLKKEYGIGKDEKTILYVGSTQLRKIKMFYRVIPRILRAEPRARFIFAGGIRLNFKDDILRILAEQNLPSKILFLGKTGYTKVIGLLKAADIFVHPAVYENFPYTCMEAMVCRRAIVSTQAGGIPEMIENGKSGTLVPPRDHNATAEAIMELMNSPDRQTTLGGNARKRAETLFDHIEVAEKTLEVYKEICR